VSAFLQALALMMALADDGATSEIPACQFDERYDTPSKQRSHRRPISPADYRGKSAAQLRARFGQPECRGPDKWRYVYPPGCTDWRTVVTLWLSRGRVSRVNIVDHYTGQHCR